MRRAMGVLNYYSPIHFSVQELVPENVFRVMGKDAIQLLDPKMLYTIDCLREFFGTPLIINDYKWGGKNQYRGFRPPKCDYGSSLSMHRLGRAYDIKPIGISAKQMRLKIIENNSLFPYISRIEDVVDWVHIDSANIDSNGIVLFKP